MQTDDKIHPLTRWVAVLVVPFLWFAFLILFFNPDTTGERFAWAIKPHMTALYMGAGYIGGSWLFINAAMSGKRWHHIAGGFLPITTFTWFMMFATFLHWDRFALGSLGFNTWLVLYIVTPFLVPVLWYLNRKEDTGQPDEKDVLISTTVGWVLKLMGFSGLLFAVVGFFYPPFAIQAWPWTLTPLTARVICGWIALLSVGAFTMSNEPRWSGWKVPLESIAIWHVLVFVAAFMNPTDFKTGLVNWYMISIGVMLIAVFIFYPLSEMRRRRRAK